MKLLILTLLTLNLNPAMTIATFAAEPQATEAVDPLAVEKSQVIGTISESNKPVVLNGKPSKKHGKKAAKKIKRHLKKKSAPKATEKNTEKTTEN